VSGSSIGPDIPGCAIQRQRCTSDNQYAKRLETHAKFHRLQSPRDSGSFASIDGWGDDSGELGWIPRHKKPATWLNAAGWVTGLWVCLWLHGADGWWVWPGDTVEVSGDTGDRDTRVDRRAGGGDVGVDGVDVRLSHQVRIGAGVDLLDAN